MPPSLFKQLVFEALKNEGNVQNLALGTLRSWGHNHTVVLWGSMWPGGSGIARGELFPGSPPVCALAGVPG